MSIELNKIVKYGLKLNNSLINYDFKKSKEYLNHIKFYSQKGGEYPPTKINKEITTFENILEQISKNPKLYNISEIRNELEGQIATKITELTKSYEENAKLEKELEELRKKFSTTSSQQEALGNTLSEKLNTTQTELTAKEAELKAKEAELKTKESELNAKKEELKTKESELGKCLADKNSTSTELSAKNEELKKLEKSIVTLLSAPEMGDIPANIQGELNTAFEQLKIQKNKCKELQENFNKISEKLTTTTAGLASSTAELAASTAGLAASTAELEAAKLDLATVKEELAKINKKSISLDTEIADLRAQIEKLNQQIAELTAKNTELTKENDDIKKEFSAFDNKKAVKLNETFMNLLTAFLGKENAENLIKDPNSFTMPPLPERVTINSPSKPSESSSTTALNSTPPTRPEEEKVKTSQRKLDNKKYVRPDDGDDMGGGGMSIHYAINDAEETMSDEITLTDITRNIKLKEQIENEGIIIKPPTNPFNLKIGDFIAFINIDQVIVGCIKEFKNDDNDNLKFIFYYKWNKTIKKWDDSVPRFIKISDLNSYKEISEIEYPYEVATKLKEGKDENDNIIITEIRLNKTNGTPIELKINDCIKLKKDDEEIVGPSIIGFVKQGTKIRYINYKYWNDKYKTYFHNSDYDFIDLFSQNSYYDSIEIITCIDRGIQDKEREIKLQQENDDRIKQESISKELSIEQKIRVKQLANDRASKERLLAIDQARKKRESEEEKENKLREENAARLAEDERLKEEEEKSKKEKIKNDIAKRIAYYVDNKKNSIIIKTDSGDKKYTVGDCITFEHKQERVYGKIKNFNDYTQSGGMFTFSTKSSNTDSSNPPAKSNWFGFTTKSSPAPAPAPTEAVGKFGYVDGFWYILYDANGIITTQQRLLSLVDKEVNYNKIEIVNECDFSEYILKEKTILNQSDLNDLYTSMQHAANNPNDNAKASFELLTSNVHDLVTNLNYELNSLSKWEEAVDPESGKSYWYNSGTGKTTWNNPNPIVTEVTSKWEEAKDPESGESYWYNSGTGETTWNNPNPIVPEPEVTSEWEEAEDPASGKSYWYNSGTGETTWDNPKPEWQETVDPKSGRSYWFNSGTGETTWEPQEGGAGPDDNVNYLQNIDDIIVLLDEVYKIYNSEIILKIIGLLSDKVSFDKVYSEVFKDKSRESKLKFIKLFFIDIDDNSSIFNDKSEDNTIYNLFDGLTNVKNNKVIKISDRINRDTNIYKLYDSTDSGKKIFTFTLIYLLKSIPLDNISILFGDAEKTLEITKILLKLYTNIKSIMSNYNNIISQKSNISRLYNELINKKRKVFTFIKIRSDTTNINPRYKYEIIDNQKVMDGVINKYLTLRYYNVDGIFGKGNDGYKYDDANEQLKEARKEYYYFGPFDGIYREKIKKNKEIADDTSKLLFKKLINDDQDICVIGYGQSGSGKTSTLIYLNVKSPQGGVIEQQGIIMELCNKNEIYDRFDYINLKIVDIYLYHGTGINEPADINISRDYKYKLIGGIEYTEYSTDAEGKLVPVLENGKPKILVDNNPQFNYKNGGWYLETQKYNNDSIKEKTLGECINDAFNIREIEPTPNNPDSSRSHIIACITLHKKVDDGKSRYRNIVVCDLAGVENVFDCNNKDELQKFDMQYQKSGKYKTSKPTETNKIKLDRYFCDQEVGPKLVKTESSIPGEGPTYKLIEQYNNSLPRALPIVRATGGASDTEKAEKAEKAARMKKARDDANALSKAFGDSGKKKVVKKKLQSDAASDSETDSVTSPDPAPSEPDTPTKKKKKSSEAAPAPTPSEPVPAPAPNEPDTPTKKKKKSSEAAPAPTPSEPVPAPAPSQPDTPTKKKKKSSEAAPAPTPSEPVPAPAPSEPDPPTKKKKK
jgi:septal ring factor EnvC (AmiA/AmiB activator)